MRRRELLLRLAAPAESADGFRLRLELARAAALETRRMELSASAPTPDLLPGDDPAEAEGIEAALEAQGYFCPELPLTYDEQDLLQTACEESGVPYALALAVIRQETGFRNILGDDGQSAGYMQVQARWHAERMDRLGVTDLLDPGGNFRVGCDFLGELLGRYSLEDALTYYNSGRTGPSAYASAVMAGMEEYAQWIA